MLALASIESFVPERHPLRQMKPLVDEVLRELSPTFDEMYSSSGACENGIESVKRNGPDSAVRDET